MATHIQLKNKDAFERILANYVISEHAQNVVDQVRDLVLKGPAAAGRNTIINYHVATKDYKFIISDTTRPPKFRDGKMEEHGKQYFFRKEEDVLKELQQGEFFEAELIHQQQVSGTSIRELERALEEQKTAINEYEWRGALNFLDTKKDARVVAIFPPSFREWISRFQAREDITDEEFRRRVFTASSIVDVVLQDNRISIVINDEYHRAADEVDKIAQREARDVRRSEDALTLLRDDHEHISELLKSA